MTEGGQAKRGKRGQGEGSYIRLPDNRVRWRVMVTTQAGERRPQSGTAKNMTEARKAVKAVRDAAERNKLPPRERVTVAQLVEAYIEHQSPRLKGRGVSNYQAILRRNIMPGFGHLIAQGVTVARLREFYAELRFTGKGQGDSVRRQVHNLINAAYKHGLSESVVTVNPAASTRPVYTERGNAKRLQAFTPEQAARFYRLARADRWGWPLAFMLATGLRPGECLGLQWEDVTFNPDGSAVVRVERTLSVDGGKVYEDTPKTDRGRRSLSVTGDAVGILRDSQARQKLESTARLRFRGHPYQVTPYVFTSAAGTRWRPDNLRRPMSRLCKAAGVPVLTPHKLRHTFTSGLAAAGVPVEVLSEHLGHSSANVTREFYRHVFDAERAGLTYNPLGDETAPAPEPQRITVKVKRLSAKAASGNTPSAAPVTRPSKSKGRV